MIACALGGEGPRRSIRALARIIARLNAHQHAGRISQAHWHRLVAAAITEFQEERMPKPEGLPDGLAEPLMQLWRSQQPITVQLRPRDAWFTLGVIQFASRNPALNADERHMVEQFGRELQRVRPRSTHASRRIWRWAGIVPTTSQRRSDANRPNLCGGGLPPAP